MFNTTSQSPEPRPSHSDAPVSLPALIASDDAEAMPSAFQKKTEAIWMLNSETCADQIVLKRVPEFLIFRRTWSYRWIGGPTGLVLALVGLLGDVQAISWETVALRTCIVAGGLSLALGLWLPSRWAVWPLRVLGGLVALMVTHENLNALMEPRSAQTLTSWMSLLETLEHLKGFLTVGLYGLWFAGTGKLGWKEWHRPVIL